MTKPIVYIASPYTLRDGHVANDDERVANVRDQIGAAECVRAFGGVPVVPLLSHYSDAVVHHDYQVWMAEDIEILLRVADYVLRLPGASPGADRECATARLHGIPVCHGVIELAAALGKVDG